MNRIVGALLGSMLVSGVDPRAFSLTSRQWGCRRSGFYAQPSVQRGRRYPGTAEQQRARIAAAEAKRARKCERRLREGRHISGGVA